MKLNIAGYEFTAASVDAGERPKTSISVSKHNVHVKVALPAWQSDWGTHSGTELRYSTDGGASWKYMMGPENWGNQYVPGPVWEHASDQQSISCLGQCDT